MTSFCIAPYKVIALPTIVKAIVIALLLLKAIAESNEKLFAVAFNSKKEQQQSLMR